MHARVGTLKARAGRLAGHALLLGLAAIGLGACINIDEGCTYPPEIGAASEIPFVLDAEHPVATSRIEVALSKLALPGDVEDRGARLKVTLADAPDVTLTLVPEGSGAPLPLLATRGMASLPLDQCLPDEPCTVRMLAIVEWLQPGAFSEPATLTVEGLARVPHTKKHCGLPSDVVTVTTTPPAPRPPAARATTGEDTHDATELVQHVAVRFDDGLAGGDGDAGASADEPVVARGHLGITADPEPPELGPMGTAVTGMWLRVTPDDGGPPILDGPISTDWPPLPADATFPIDASCARPCERGYWIQAKVYDPAGRTNPDPATAVFGWLFDASVSSAEPADSLEGAITVASDAPDDRQPPPSLVLQGTGAPFRLDGGHTAATLVIDASAPARPTPPLGDSIADVPVVFRLTTVGADPRQVGQLFLSNGHYIGDGSTADDEKDTGATGGPTTLSSPAGHPFAACEGLTEACSARTGLVLRHYTSVFDKGVPTPPYDVHWEWTVVGAPPGSTVNVHPVEGETLGVLGVTPPPWQVVVGVLVAGAVVLGLAIRGVRTRRRTPETGTGERT